MPASRECLVGQIIDSQRRRRYVTDYLASADISASSLDPSSRAFDPLRGALLSVRAGDVDEACWLVFLSVHFGHHRVFGWALPAAFYGRLGTSPHWSWGEVCRDPDAVGRWLDSNQARMRGAGHRFGNHRKYESLSSNGTGCAVATYVRTVEDAKSATSRPEDVGSASTDPFDDAFRALDSVYRFGRTARFDYLTMLEKTRIFPQLVPQRAYLAGATGPLRAARLLIDGAGSPRSTTASLELSTQQVRNHLAVPNDVLEDALCNWQKSPTAFLPFRG